MSVDSACLPSGANVALHHAEREMSNHIYGEVLNRLRKIQVMMGPHSLQPTYNEINKAIADFSCAVELKEIDG